MIFFFFFFTKINIFPSSDCRASTLCRWETYRFFARICSSKFSFEKRKIFQKNFLTERNRKEKKKKSLQLFFSFKFWPLRRDVYVRITLLSKKKVLKQFTNILCDSIFIWFVCVALENLFIIYFFLRQSSF